MRKNIVSSTIMPVSGNTLDSDDTQGAERVVTEPPLVDSKNPLLVAVGERVRQLRSRRGMTRKATAHIAQVSERHLANLEYGLGNASILVLHQVAQALQCSLAELMGDVTTSSPEWLLLREMLEGRDEGTLRRVRVAVGELLGTGGANDARSHRVALIGLRGAGKSTLGQLLAEDLGFPFVELSHEIEKFAGCSASEIQALYGQNAYRRYERRALEEAAARRAAEEALSLPTEQGGRDGGIGRHHHHLHRARVASDHAGTRPVRVVIARPPRVGAP